MTSAITEFRLKLLAAGFDPTPAQGKEVFLTGWNQVHTAEEIRTWEPRYPNWRNSGMQTRNAPTFDTDILMAEAADAVEELVRRRFDERGTILTRVGLFPKRAFPFKTKTPFAKIRVEYLAPDRSEHAVEFLGDGQQVIVDGIHPDTKKPYQWHGGYRPGEIRRNDLPEIDEAEARAFVAEVTATLAEGFGFILRPAKPKGNGPGAEPPADFTGTDGRLDVDACLSAMAPSGGSANATQPRVLLSLLQRRWHPDEAIERIVAATMAMAEEHKLGWTRERETREVVARCVCEVNKLCREYDPTTGTIPAWLVGEFHDAWVNTLVQGRRPWLALPHGRWQVCPATGAPEGREQAVDASGPGAESNGNAGNAGDADGAAKGAGKPGAFLRSFVAFDPALLPPREFLYGRHYQRATVAATAAPGGSGKTSLCLVECIAMATCRNLLGEQPAQRLKVWFHNGEDNLEELQRRVAAICQHYAIPLSELEGWLFLTSGDEVPLRVATGYGDLKINSALIAAIHSEIAHNEIDVAVFDPLVTLHNVSENDSGKMDSVVGVFKGVASQQQCAIVLVHHTRKQASGAAGSDYVASDMRGTSATHDAVRALRLINHMSPKEAEAAAIPEHERTSYIRVDRGKGNNSPPTKAVWRRIINVDLPNGDEVGVVVPWNFPGQNGGAPTAEIFEAEQTAEHVFLQLLNRFTLEGRVVSERPNWANYGPKLFAAETEAKIAHAGREALAAAMRRLFKAKRIRVEDDGAGGRRVHKLVPVHDPEGRAE